MRYRPRCACCAPATSKLSSPVPPSQEPPMLDGKFCATCQKKGHLCPAATVQDGIGLCAFCQDEEECPVSKREKEVAAKFGKAAVPPPGRPVLAPAKAKVQRAQEVKEEKTMDICVKPNCGKPMSHR